jgi:hypothetical protein
VKRRCRHDLGRNLINFQSWRRDKRRKRLHQELWGLATEADIETPTREQLAKLDRKRANKGSNDWTHPHDPMNAALLHF